AEPARDGVRGDGAGRQVELRRQVLADRARDAVVAGRAVAGVEGATSVAERAPGRAAGAREARVPDVAGEPCPPAVPPRGDGPQPERHGLPEPEERRLPAPRTARPERAGR